MNQDQLVSARERAYEMLKNVGVVLTETERSSLEIATFGLNDFENQGLTLLVYANTDRYCGKELVLFPHQSCPEHRHPPVALEDGRKDPGKMETFRCRSGTIYLYIEGTPSKNVCCDPPRGSEAYYTVSHEVVLRPGQQFTIEPNTRHWFQAGPDGAIATEFSSTSRDELDVFTDSRIQRVTAT